LLAITLTKRACTTPTGNFADTAFTIDFSTRRVNARPNRLGKSTDANLKGNFHKYKSYSKADMAEPLLPKMEDFHNQNPLSAMDFPECTHPESRVLLIGTGGTICMQASPDGLQPIGGFLESAMAPRPCFNDRSSPKGMKIHESM